MQVYFAANGKSARHKRRQVTGREAELSRQAAQHLNPIGQKRDNIKAQHDLMPPQPGEAGASGTKLSATPLDEAARSPPKRS